MMGATSRTGTVYPSIAPKLPPLFVLLSLLIVCPSLIGTVVVVIVW